MIYRAYAGGKEIKDFYIGGKETKEIWGGDTLLWEKEDGVTDPMTDNNTFDVLFRYFLGVEIKNGSITVENVSVSNPNHIPTYEFNDATGVYTLSAGDEPQSLMLWNLPYDAMIYATIYGKCEYFRFIPHEGAVGGIHILEKILNPIPKGLITGKSLKRFMYHQYFITEVPENLYVNMLDIEDFSEIHRANYGITNMPRFANSKKAKTFENAFEVCDSLKEITYDFSENRQVESFRRCFDTCENARGKAPELWKIFPKADGRGCFNGCKKLENVTEIPDDWYDYI